jgi:hypothetical protein
MFSTGSPSATAIPVAVAHSGAATKWCPMLNRRDSVEDESQSAIEPGFG